MPVDILINGAQLPQEFTSLVNEEADLDIQVASPLIYPQNLTLFASNLTVVQTEIIVTSSVNLTTKAGSSVALLLAIEVMLSSFGAACCCIGCVLKS